MRFIFQLIVLLKPDSEILKIDLFIYNIDLDLLYKNRFLDSIVDKVTTGT